MIAGEFGEIADVDKVNCAVCGVKMAVQPAMEKLLSETTWRVYGAN
jgi:hypothetical protein